MMSDTGLTAINVEQLNNAVSRLVNAAGSVVAPPTGPLLQPLMPVLPPPQPHLVAAAPAQHMVAAPTINIASNTVQASAGSSQQASSQTHPPLILSIDPATQKPVLTVDKSILTGVMPDKNVAIQTAPGLTAVPGMALRLPFLQQIVTGDKSSTQQTPSVPLQIIQQSPQVPLQVTQNIATTPQGLSAGAILASNKAVASQGSVAQNTVLPSTEITVKKTMDSDGTTVQTIQLPYPSQTQSSIQILPGISVGNSASQPVQGIALTPSSALRTSLVPVTTTPTVSVMSSAQPVAMTTSTATSSNKPIMPQLTSSGVLNLTSQTVSSVSSGSDKYVITLAGDPNKEGTKGLVITQSPASTPAVQNPNVIHIQPQNLSSVINQNIGNHAASQSAASISQSGGVRTISQILSQHSSAATAVTSAVPIQSQSDLTKQSQSNKLQCQSQAGQSQTQSRPVQIQIVQPQIQQQVQSEQKRQRTEDQSSISIELPGGALTSEKVMKLFQAGVRERMGQGLQEAISDVLRTHATPNTQQGLTLPAASANQPQPSTHPTQASANQMQANQQSVLLSSNQGAAQETMSGVLLWKPNAAGINEERVVSVKKGADGSIELLETGGPYPVLQHSPSSPAATTKGHYCVVCNAMYPEECSLHMEGMVHLPDNPVTTKARMSLPRVLTLKVANNDNAEAGSIPQSVLGVFAFAPISIKTRFGPLEGPEKPATALEDSERALQHMWQIFHDDEAQSMVLDCHNEDECNWLMFMRRAKLSAEQNVVAYQEGNHVYFITCCNVASGKELLYWYSRDYAKLLGVPTKPEDLFRCSLCSKPFADMKKYNSHIKYVHADMTNRKWKCQICARAFTTSGKLNTHMLGHMGMKPYKCHHCDKTFSDQSNLRMHISIHTGERRFKCPQCGKAFRQKAHMTSHLLTHTGEKKLPCQYCDRWFARASDLKQHQYNHTKETTFVCDHPGCSKVFYLRKNYKKHYKLHAADREHACDKCGKPFTSKYHKERHMASCKRFKEISVSINVEGMSDMVQKAWQVANSESMEVDNTEEGSTAESGATMENNGKPTQGDK